MTRNASRRQFLRQATALAGLGAAAPMALNLLAATSAAAQVAPSDYRALVCVFLYGGNDCHNTVLPLDSVNHDTFKRIRGADYIPDVATLEATELKPVVPWPDDRRMALHPSMSRMADLFGAGQVSLAMNIGTLRADTTKPNHEPPKLFSHNDQQAFWQSSLTEGATSGWGGRMADLLVGSNTNSVFTAISAAGNAVFLSGRDVVQYQVNAQGSAPGAVEIDPRFGDVTTSALKDMLMQTREHWMEQAHADIASRSIANAQIVNGALGGALPGFPTTSLGAQLQLVARLIAARSALGAQRQVFFVSMGGFDVHDNMLAAHPLLLGAVSDAMAAFHQSMQSMGLGRQVISFTASDFGRALANNGDGCDHGWGGHHLVVSEAVQPGSWFGGLPKVSLVAGDDNVGNGRLRPAVGVDPFGATLARWFGVADADLPTVFPNIGGFDRPVLDFLRA